MKLSLDKKAFKKFEGVFFAVVYGKNINNIKHIPETENIPKETIDQAEKYFENKNIKETKEITLYRKALIKSRHKFTHLVKYYYFHNQKIRVLFYSSLFFSIYPITLLPLI